MFYSSYARNTPVIKYEYCLLMACAYFWNYNIDEEKSSVNILNPIIPHSKNSEPTLYMIFIRVKLFIRPLEFIWFSFYSIRGVYGLEIGQKKSSFTYFFFKSFVEFWNPSSFVLFSSL